MGGRRITNETIRDSGVDVTEPINDGANTILEERIQSQKTVHREMHFIALPHNLINLLSRRIFFKWKRHKFG